MKTITPRTILLERELGAAQAYNIELQAKIDRLQQTLREYQRASRIRSVRKLEVTSKSTTETRRNPRQGYLNPTIASAGRAAIFEIEVKLETKLTEKPSAKPKYDDGRIVAVPHSSEDEEPPNLFRHTQASANRAGLEYPWECNWSRKMKLGFNPTAPGYGSSCNSPDLQAHATNVESATADSEDDEKIDCRGLGDAVARCPFSDTDSIKRRSRLMDNGFYFTTQSKCYVPFSTQKRLLRSARDVAQKTLWHALHQHPPRVQERLYPACPDEVEFGRSKLESQFCSERSAVNRLCGLTLGDIRLTLYNIIFLRNDIPPHDLFEQRRNR